MNKTVQQSNNMKRNYPFPVHFLQLCILLLAAACSNHDTWVEQQPIPENAIEVAVSFDVPGMSASTTRALTDIDESAINTIHVLVFKANKYQYTTEGYDKGGNTFMVKLPKGETLDLTILANVEQHLAALAQEGYFEPGRNKADVLAAVSEFRQPDAWETTDETRYLPMWAERTDVTVSTGNEFTSEAIALTRMHAAIDVTVNVEGFELEEVWLCNANTVGYLIADDERENYSASDNMQKYTVGTGTNACCNAIYTPEAPAGSDDKIGENACLVVKARYNDYTGYYRIDFVSQNTQSGDDEYFPLERNHQYSIQIVEVNGQGYDSAQDALVASTAPLNTDITTWDAGQIGNVQSAGGYMLGVSATTINLPSEGVTSEAPVTLTIVSQGADPEITFSDDNDENIMCEVVSSSNGLTTINITATPNLAETERKSSLTIAVGELKQTVTITQEDATPTIKIYDKDGNEITNDGVYAIEYESIDTEMINCDFRVEWTPAHLEMKVVFEESNDTDGSVAHWTCFHLSSINKGMLLNKNAETGPYTGGVKTMSPRTKGIAFHTDNAASENYDGRINMCGKFTVKVGNRSKQFTMRVWTPYAAFDESSLQYTPANLGTTKTINVYYNKSTTLSNVENRSAVRPQITTKFLEQNQIKLTPTTEGVMETKTLTINIPQDATYHNFYGRKETLTIDVPTCIPRSRTKQLTIDCVETFSTTVPVTYAYHNDQLIWVKKNLKDNRAWMNHDLRNGATGGKHFRRYDPLNCPPGMTLPTVSEMNNLVNSGLDFDAGRPQIYCIHHMDNLRDAQYFRQTSYIPYELSHSTSYLDTQFKVAGRKDNAWVTADGTSDWVHQRWSADGWGQNHRAHYYVPYTVGDTGCSCTGSTGAIQRGWGILRWDISGTPINNEVESLYWQLGVSKRQTGTLGDIYAYTKLHDAPTRSGSDNNYTWTYSYQNFADKQYIWRDGNGFTMQTTYNTWYADYLRQVVSWGQVAGFFETDCFWSINTRTDTDAPNTLEYKTGDHTAAVNVPTYESANARSDFGWLTVMTSTEIHWRTASTTTSTVPNYGYGCFTVPVALPVRCVSTVTY